MGNISFSPLFPRRSGIGPHLTQCSFVAKSFTQQDHDVFCRFCVIGRLTPRYGNFNRDSLHLMHSMWPKN